MAPMDHREILTVPGNHLEQVVIGSGHQMAFQHVRDARHGGLKGVQDLIRLSREADLNKHGCRAPDAPGIQQRHMTRDHAH